MYHFISSRVAKVTPGSGKVAPVYGMLYPCFSDVLQMGKLKIAQTAFLSNVLSLGSFGSSSLCNPPPLNGAMMNWLSRTAWVEPQHTTYKWLGINSPSVDEMIIRLTIQ